MHTPGNSDVEFPRDTPWAQRHCLVRAVVNAEEGVGVSAALDLFNSLTGDPPCCSPAPALIDASMVLRSSATGLL